jgi:hypothetical protein
MKTAVHQYEDKLLEFAYGELPTSEADAVEAHVRGCARCTKALGEIRAVRSTMAALPQVPAPDAGLESLLAYAEQAAARQRAAASPWASWRRFLAPLASALALVVVGVVAWRAKETFDPDAGLLALEAQRKVAPTPEPVDGKLAPAPAAAPVAAAVPEQSPASGAAQAPAQPAEEAAFASETRRELQKQERKKGRPVDEKADSGGDKTLLPQSVAKRARSKEEAPARQAAGALADDYSNAAQRGALGGGSADGRSSSIGYGLGAAGGLDPNASAVGEALPARPMSKPAPAAAPPPAPKSSFGLPGMSASRAPAPASARAEAEAEELAASATDALSADRDAKVAEREAAASRSKALAEARALGAKGDREGEIALLKKVLGGGVSGAERVETLKRLCDAYEALALYEQADAYCDALLREYPNSAAAQAVTARRNAVQRAAPVKSKSAPAGQAPAAPAVTPAD